ncbi:MAG: alpha/beta hydrolase [Bryobacteraceae bacterium]|nr:alpha/beta hydrolase [Bryobacteraceae bacterium]
MASSLFYPYRSEASRDRCFAYLDSVAARTWPAASESRTVTTSYGTTFVRVTGPREAPPLVLLAGATGTSLMWAPNISALSAHFRTFAVDQAGDFGRSLCTRPLPTLEDLLAWMTELFDALDLRRGLNLAGMSYGGALTVQYALRFPERLKKIVLLAPGSTVFRTPLKFMARVLLIALSRRRFIPPFLRWVFPAMTRKDPQWVQTVIDQTLLNFDNMQKRPMPFPPVLTDAEWRALKVPTLFLVGEHEVIYPAAKALRRLRSAAPSVTAECIPAAGHDLTFAQTQLVNTRILEFLRQ